MSPETISTGPAASSGSAVAMPPAVSSGSASRDQRMRTPNAAPSPSAAVELLGEVGVVDHDVAVPGARSASICQTISGLPPAGSSGLGRCR